MEIKTDKRVVSGHHNGSYFTLDGGCLYMFGANLDRKDIKNLIEVVTLLRAQGFELGEKPEISRKVKNILGFDLDFGPGEVHGG